MLKWMQKLLKMNGGVKMIDDDDPVFEKDPNELEDVQLDEDDDEDNQRGNNAQMDYPTEIDSIVDKHTGEPIDFEVEQDNSQAGGKADEAERQLQEQKFELLRLHKIMNDL